MQGGEQFFTREPLRFFNISQFPLSYTGKIWLFGSNQSIKNHLQKTLICNKAPVKVSL